MVTTPFTPGPAIFLGTDGADTLVGTDAAEIFYGFGGNDSMSGMGGNDTITSGAGTNRIDGGTGDDVIVIDRSATNGVMLTPADGVVGGDGYDTLKLLGNVSEFHIVNTVGFGLTITDLSGGARTIATGIEHLQFNDLDIWLVDPNVTAPTVSGVVTAATVEGGLPVSVNLLALASDPDPNAALAVTGLGPLADGISYDATTATLTLDPAAYEYLGQGVTEVVTVVYQVTDGLHTVDALAQISVTGENDAAAFTGLSGAMTEDAASLSGHVAVSDIDAGEAALATQGVFASTHGVWTLSGGDWTFRLDGDLLDVQALAAGSLIVDRLAVSSLDGTTAEISATIQGVADSWQLGDGTVNGTNRADRLYGMDGSDVLSGRGGADLLDGRGGADRLLAGDGADRVIWDAADLLADGGAGHDTLVLRGAAVVNLSTADQVAGDAGVTRGFEAVDATFALDPVDLTGTGAANRLIGGFGSDLLAGGRGADVLTGGHGADVFVFAARGSVDHITDFELGTDHLQVAAGTIVQWAEMNGSTRVDLGGTVVSLDGVTGLGLSDFLFV